MSFDYSKHVMKVQGGKEYVPVSALLMAFREKYGDDGFIKTDLIKCNVEEKYAIFKATVGVYTQIGPGEKVLATAHNMENVKGFADWLTKAETSAIGRALREAGIGIQYAGDEFNEQERYADAPIEERRQNNTARQQNNTDPEPVDEKEFKRAKLEYRNLLSIWQNVESVSQDQQFAAYNKMLKRTGEEANQPPTLEGLNRCIDILDQAIKKREANPK